MPAEGLDQLRGMHGADCVEHGAECAAAAADSIVADDDEHVDLFVDIERIEEPLLLHHRSCGRDDTRVRVPREIEQHAEGHDAQAMLSSEKAVFRTSILVFAGVAVEDLHVGRDIPVAIVAGDVVEGLIGDFRNIEFVVANREKVVVDVLKDRIGVLASETGRIREAGAVVEIAFTSLAVALQRSHNALRGELTSVNKQQIDSQLLRLRLHVPRERHKVTPIGSIVLLLKMSLQPAMGISRLQEVDLPPFKLASRSVSSILRIGLHATDDTLVGDEVGRSIAGVAGDCG